MRFGITTSNKMKQFELKFGIPFVQRTFRTIIQLYESPNTWTSGMSSVCKDGRHVLFFDYDKIGDLKRIEDELKFIQDYYNLSHAYIFQTGDENFHAVILDKHSLRDTFEILKNTNVDHAFVNSIKFLRGREWILRIAEKGNRPKPVFVKVLKSKYASYEVSTAHKLFLQKYYSVPKLKYKFEDNITEIPLVNYNTGNRVE